MIAPVEATDLSKDSKDRLNGAPKPPFKEIDLNLATCKKKRLRNTAFASLPYIEKPINPSEAEISMSLRS